MPSISQVRQRLKVAFGDDYAPRHLAAARVALKVNYSPASDAHTFFFNEHLSEGGSLEIALFLAQHDDVELVVDMGLRSGIVEVLTPENPALAEDHEERIEMSSAVEEVLGEKWSRYSLLELLAILEALGIEYWNQP